MSAIARDVGVSRQAVYLYFPDRASLLTALVAHVDVQEQLQRGIDVMDAAQDAASEIRAWVEMQAWRNPRIVGVARALDHTRHEDESASEAWRNRTANRMGRAVEIVGRLHREGRLHPSWRRPEAAVLLWELTSFRVWDDLVNEAGLPPAAYVEVITAATLSALAGPVGKPRRASRRPPSS
jgi:AcrR family transcriptional regulator